eukprot:gene1612-2848_t
MALVANALSTASVAALVVCTTASVGATKDDAHANGAHGANTFVGGPQAANARKLPSFKRVTLSKGIPRYEWPGRPPYPLPVGTAPEPSPSLWSRQSPSSDGPKAIHSALGQITQWGGAVLENGQSELRPENESLSRWMRQGERTVGAVTGQARHRPPPASSQAHRTLRVLSWNILQAENADWPCFAEQISALAPDIVCLQGPSSTRQAYCAALEQPTLLYLSDQRLHPSLPLPPSETPNGDWIERLAAETRLPHYAWGTRASGDGHNKYKAI